MLIAAIALTAGPDAGCASGRSERACADLGALLSEGAHVVDRSQACADVEHALALTDECGDPSGAVAFRMAERLRDCGDPRAPGLYESAIRAAPDEPDYEVGYADYLRVYRGPLQPLFPEAEEHYYRGRRKLMARADRPRKQQTEALRRRLASLYERDGVPFVYWSAVPGLRDADENRPLAFFSSQNRFARALDAFDQVDDVRDFTLAAKFAASDRFHRDLTQRELRSLVHPRYQWETIDRLRFRYRWLPVLDLFFADHHADDAQVTSFDDVDAFNDVDVREYGVGVERTFDLYPYLDLAIRAEWVHGVQEGLIEFEPADEEDFDAVRILATGSRFVGPDKLSFEARYFYQDLDQDTETPIDRSREIVGATIRYQQFTPATFRRLFDLRNNEVFAGFALDTEQFGEVDLHRNDAFVGAALRGLRWLNGDTDRHAGRLDLEVQPTVFSGDREGSDRGRRVSSLSNTQYRTALTALYRFVDSENVSLLADMHSLGPAHLVFLNVVLPAAHDMALDGPDDFESFRVGVDLATKVIFASTTDDLTYFGATVLAQAGYRLQRYYQISESDHLFDVSVRIGF